MLESLVLPETIHPCFGLFIFMTSSVFRFDILIFLMLVLAMVLKLRSFLVFFLILSDHFALAVINDVPIINIVNFFSLGLFNFLHYIWFRSLFHLLLLLLSLVLVNPMSPRISIRLRCQVTDLANRGCLVVRIEEFTVTPLPLLV